MAVIKYKDGDNWIPIKTLPAALSEYTGTLLSTEWSGSTAPYMQTISITELGETAKLQVGLASTATTDEVLEASKAMLLATAQASGSVTISAFKKLPTINIPIIIREVA